MLLEDPKVLAIIKLAEEFTKLKNEKKSEPIGVGNLCNRQFYEYSNKNARFCPICGGEVRTEYENLTLNYYYDILAGFPPLGRPGTMCYDVCYYKYKPEDIYLFGLKKCEKQDENGFYLAINGKKYPLPQNMNWIQLCNNTEFNKKIFRNAMDNWDDVCEIVGSGGGIYGRNVIVYVCDKCGYQYHLVSISSFIHRDMSKDGIPDK